MRINWQGVSAAAALALIFGFYGWQIWKIPVQPKHQPHYQHSRDSAEKTIGPKSAEERTADYTEALADYTEALVFVTFLLAVVSSVQIGFLIRADRTARVAADAAHRSAGVAEKALDQTSAPYLDVTATPKAIIHRFPGGGISAEFMDKTVSAEYVIHNYGQSPAIILEIYQSCIRSAGLPSEISFPPPQSNLQKTYVVGGMKESGPFPIGYPTGGVDSLDGNEATWIGLQIRYRDVFRNRTSRPIAPPIIRIARHSPPMAAQNTTTAASLRAMNLKLQRREMNSAPAAIT